MPHSFPNIGNAAEFVGQTPWSARDALVPLSARRIKALHATMADEGVGRGRGRPPYNLRRCSAMGKLCGITLTVAALLPTDPTPRRPAAYRPPGIPAMGAGGGRTVRLWGAVSSRGDGT